MQTRNALSFSMLFVVPMVLACSSSSSPAPAGGDPRAQTLALARDNLPCTTDADCCAVVDDCMNDVYVVSATDKAKAASLLASADASRCTSCIPPATQVSCASTGFCTAVKVECTGSLFSEGMKDHCGKLTLPAGCALKPASLGAPVPSSKVVLHCG
jgi:hypothetical protein